MDWTYDFNDFLSKIRPTKRQRNNCIKGHKTLRKRLESDSSVKDLIVATFLQGSYKRRTAVRPKSGDLLDVDVVVVTNLDQSKYTPAQALAIFEQFAKEYYPGKWERQGRSVGVTLSNVALDIVPTSAPSEVEKNQLQEIAAALEEDEEDEDDGLDENAETDEESVDDTDEVKNMGFMQLAQVYQKRVVAGYNLSAQLLFETKAAWKDEQLWIPDREQKVWQATHPIAQAIWTIAKNERCEGHYVNVVKALKWWRSRVRPEPKYPKSYPLEHLIGACCPDGITSVAQGITETLEAIVGEFRKDADAAQTPSIVEHPKLVDHGVEGVNVLSRVDGEDFKAFYAHVQEAAEIARRAYNSTTRATGQAAWYELFGYPFPNDGDDDEGLSGNGSTGGKGTTSASIGGYTPRSEKSDPEGGRFALS